MVGMPHSKQNSPRREVVVGFLVREYLANKVEIINDVLEVNWRCCKSIISF